MLAALVAAVITFSVIFLGLRGLERLYHHLRHTPDWSPHWGSWLFAVLAGIGAFLEYYGR